MYDFEFELGQEVKDKITGYSGIIIGRTQWLTNCNTYSVKPKVLKDGVPMDSIGFDEPSLVLVEPKPIMKESRSVGGPVGSAIPPSRSVGVSR